MKDLTFYGENLVFRSGGVIKVTYRTDLIGGNRNFTVHQITGLEELNVEDDILKKGLYSEFKKLPYSLDAFIAFAQANYLELTSQESDGSGVQVLVEGYGSDSVPGTESWFELN